MEWIGLAAILAVMTLTIGFIRRSLLSGRIVFQGRQRASRSTNLLAFALWLAMAFAWGGTVICLALPLVFS